jgi:Zn-dependent membrane protease YugP
MFFEHYWFLFLLLIVCLIFSGIASSKVHSTYEAFSAEKTRSNMTGYDTATRLLKKNGIHHVSVERTRGRLSDHFDPRKKVVRLS